MINFLALLGWSLNDRTEILSREELINSFSLERLGKTAAIFNEDKLNWMNGVYLRHLSLEEFTYKAMPFLEKSLPTQADRTLDYIRQIMPLIQERARTLADVPGLAEFFFIDDLNYGTDLLLGKGMSPDKAYRALAICLTRLQELDPFDATSLEALLRPLSEELGLKVGEFFSLLRVATTGRSAAPPLFQTMAVLGTERCLKRIKAALAKLHS
jgi:glutamyl-tRNA synthetase